MGPTPRRMPTRTPKDWRDDRALPPIASERPHIGRVDVEQMMPVMVDQVVDHDSALRQGAALWRDSGAIGVLIRPARFSARGAVAALNFACSSLGPQFFRSSYLANPALPARLRASRAWELQSSRLESGRPLRSE